MQHYLTAHHNVEDPKYLETMRSLFGLRLAKTTGKFVRHIQSSGGKPVTKVQEVADGVFACPVCLEQFDCRRNANKHTREAV